MFRLISLLIGYLCGNFLTAEAVTRKYKHTSVFDLGSGNPGMANVMSVCGFVPGVLCLAGDLAKTVLACVLCRFVLFGGLTLLPAAVPEALLEAAAVRAALPGHPPVTPGLLAAAWAGLGACLGHNYPFWHHFKGGEGVATTCAAIFCIRPLWGLMAMCVGMLVVFASQYLSLGAVCIPAADMIILGILYRSPELILLLLAMTILMFSRHFPGLKQIAAGTEKKVPVTVLLRRQFGRFTLPVIYAGMFLVFILALLGS